MSAGSAEDPIAALASLLGAGERVWRVGGVIRDELLGRQRPTLDCDLAVQGDARRLAGGLARAVGGFRFPLSDEFGAWRVVSRDHSRQFDLTPLAGETIESDLARRDLTINAMARELTDDGEGELIDPFGGRADLAAGHLRMVGAQSFQADPLRVVRVARFVAELGFEAQPQTVAAARGAATSLRSVAAERVFAELRQLVCAENAVAGLRVLGEVGAAAVVLPELEALRGVEQSVYHHLDVYEHTLATVQATIDAQREPSWVLPDADALTRLRRLLDEPLANDMTRGQALRFGALLHDIAKPATHVVTAEGRVTFMGHDDLGAELVASILGRLRASSQLSAYVAALTRHHLRLGFLVHQRPLSRRVLYEYLAACEPVEVDVTVLSVADRLATLGRGADQAVSAHLELARELLGPALDWHAARPVAPIPGDRLARALGIEPGPRLGAVLAELTEAAYAGEVSSEEQAVGWARQWLRTASSARSSPASSPRR